MAGAIFQRQAVNYLGLSFICLLLIFFATPALAQLYFQHVKGTVRDQETRQPVAGVTLIFTGQSIDYTAFSDGEGIFRIKIPAGRWNVMISHLGYSPKILQNITVSTGKEVSLEILLDSKVYETQEVQVSAGTHSWLSSSGGSSVRTLQSQDATRFAGGYYDPLRMVSNFAGITSGNSDESNEIVVRGNSPRGLLWRLEGLEIPNPNHLSGGVGNSGGAYSMISTDVLADFDFYSGAFPAEFGNALSGVMDLRLRKGNTEKYEYGIQLSVVGAEAAAEGPIGRSGDNSFLFNMRYANFDILKKYGIIPIQDLSIIPSSLDWTLRTNFHHARMGDLEFFSIGGKSKTGNEATENITDIKKGINNDEFTEEVGMAVFGIKHLKNFNDGKTYIRTIVGLTMSDEKWQEGIVDTNLVHIMTRQDMYSSPVLRTTVMVNRKLNLKNSVKAGIEYHRSFSDMFSIRRLATRTYDTLVDQKAQNFYTQAYFQLKFKPANAFEIIPAIHSTYTGINREVIFEPRLGVNINLAGNQSFSFGTGIYSRPEPEPIYYFRVRTGAGTRATVNSDLRSTRAFHLVAGYRKSFTDDLKISLEGYYQHLYHVPVAVSVANTFSMVNISEGLPDIDLDNKGISDNTGIELTVDKTFSHNYYFLVTASLFNSGYKASNSGWYSTYYNSNYVFNLVCGKEFKVGRYQQNALGFNLRNLARGGYRYTPVDEEQTIRKKYIVYDTDQTFGMHLPFYDRLDAGINYRINKKKSSFNFSLDIQNVTNRHNVYRRNFSYVKGVIVQTDKKLIGLVPIAGIRFDF